MKKLICLILIIIIASLAACKSDNAPLPAIPPDDEIPEISIPPLYNATIEYGEPDLITDNSGPLWAYIRYPAAGDPTDEFIAEWALNLYQNAYEEIIELRKKDPDAEGEVNVHFDSYLVDGRYAGILENGMYMSSHLAHPVSIVRTFNIDTDTGSFLSNPEILDYSQLESILSVMRRVITDEYPEASDLLSGIDEKSLEHIAIGSDGVIVMLERGALLPSYLGALQFTLQYDDLGPAYLLSEDSAASPPSETPTGTPSGTPSETPSEPSTGTPTAPPVDPPTASPTSSPTDSPTDSPTAYPTDSPTDSPTAYPTDSPTDSPTAYPTDSPTDSPTAYPTDSPTPPPTIPVVPPQSGDIDPSKPMVALTFDDGPSRYTSQILDTLEKYGVRATFCVIGNLVDARKDTVKRAFDSGCEIIGHSWDHRDLTKLSEDEIKRELNDTSSAIEMITGVDTRLYRPPYGAVNNTLKNVSAGQGYAIIYWSVDPMDWNTRNADEVYSAIMADVRDRAIVLSHDLYGSTADAMERVIPELLSRGYQLVTVSELLYYSGKTLEAGVVYYSGK